MTNKTKRKHLCAGAKSGAGIGNPCFPDISIKTTTLRAADILPITIYVSIDIIDNTDTIDSTDNTDTTDNIDIIIP